MGRCLGIDTSNYTTSAALYDDEKGNMLWSKKLLPVKEGEIGLRSSEVVFAHIKQAESIIRETIGDNGGKIDAVAVSDRPRDAEGSYMPCFLVGRTIAGAISAALGVPLFCFSHQAGHIASALYSSGRTDLIGKSFLSFHVSGGTTECLYVTPDEERIFNCEIIGRSLDLHIGQAVDRVGNMLNYPFPSGAYLEKAAEKAGENIMLKADISKAMKGNDCCISGVENNCRRYLEEGKSEEEIAQYLFDYIYKVIDRMTQEAIKNYGDVEIVYAGGVMSNGIIKRRLSEKYGCVFAAREYSSDNACGTALMGAVRYAKATGR
ncbi:MAG: peptidase M22 [Oscillospiraceae bacterium]|nr:peptidase M22 [Oscillospiraceae bacterium]